MTPLQLLDHAQRVAVFLAAERFTQPFAGLGESQCERRLGSDPDGIADDRVVLRDRI